MIIDFTNVGDLASAISILAVFFGVFLWAGRRIARRCTKALQTWVNDLVDSALEKIMPQLTNDEISAAQYAHEARDAALQSKEAAMDARIAATEARDAARDVKGTVEKINQRLGKSDNG